MHYIIYYIFFKKTTATKNEVALSYHRVRGLYFLTVAFATTITSNILQTSYQTLLSPWHRTRHTRSLPSTALHNALGTVQLFNSAYFTQLNAPTVVDANIERAKVSTKPLLHDKLLPIEEYPNFILHRKTAGDCV